MSRLLSEERRAFNRFNISNTTEMYSVWYGSFGGQSGTIETGFLCQRYSPKADIS
jgi:hypothetical protein